MQYNNLSMWCLPVGNEFGKEQYFTEYIKQAFFGYHIDKQARYHGLYQTCPEQPVYCFLRLKYMGKSLCTFN